jgi:hypothetical protein
LEKKFLRIVFFKILNLIWKIGTILNTIQEFKNMQEPMKIEGDFGNIIEYFVRMLAIQKRRNFPLHNYSFEYLHHTYITNADKNQEIESDEFPDKENVDRVTQLLFMVKGENLSFYFEVGWTQLVANVKVGDIDLESFTDLIDQSTFRFF